MLAHQEHGLASQGSALLALAHRARNLSVTSTVALRAFSLAYCELEQSEQCPIAHVELCTGKDEDLPKEELGVLLPGIRRLTLSAPYGVSLVHPCYIAGLTNCTELCLRSDGTDSETPRFHHVAPVVFAALPNLRHLSWSVPSLTSAPPTSTNAQHPSQPILGSLVSLYLLTVKRGGPFTTGLHQPHLPNLRHLITLDWLADRDRDIPPAVFDLTSLESLELKDSQRVNSIPDGIGRLTGLTRLSCADSLMVIDRITSVSPAMGDLSLLQSLVLSGHELTDIPDEVLRLTRLTELRIPGCCRACITNYPDLSRLHGLKV